MTRKVVFCCRHDKLVDLMQRMTDGKFRHLPVIEDGRLIGIVSIGDVNQEPPAKLWFDGEPLKAVLKDSATFGMGLWDH